MTITVLLFAQLADTARSRELEVTLDASARAGDALDEVVRRHPELADLRERVAIAVNDAYVAHDHALAPGDIVALIPPVSGG